MKVNVQYAQTHFPDLVSAATNGEEVEIELPNQPALLLAPRPAASAPESSTKKPRKRILGALKGKMVVPTEEEWRLMDEELTQIMTEGPLIPGETLEETRQWLGEAMKRKALSRGDENGQPSAVESHVPLLGSAKGEIRFSEGWDSSESKKQIADLFENSIDYPREHV